MSVTVGLKGRAETVVTDANTAQAACSGALPVFGTPFMCALMEEAARNMTFKVSEVLAENQFDDVLILYNFDTFQEDRNFSRITY